MSLNFHKCKFGVFVKSYEALKRNNLKYLGESVDCAFNGKIQRISVDECKNCMWYPHDKKASK